MQDEDDYSLEDPDSSSEDEICENDSDLEDESVDSISPVEETQLVNHNVTERRLFKLDNSFFSTYNTRY